MVQCRQLPLELSIKAKSIVYSDNTGSVGQYMVSLSENADLLFYDTAIPTDAPTSPMFNIYYVLHTTPSRIGEDAALANVSK